MAGRRRRVVGRRGRVAGGYGGQRQRWVALDGDRVFWFFDNEKYFLPMGMLDSHRGR